jgi:hypothetical protein
MEIGDPASWKIDYKVSMETEHILRYIENILSYERPHEDRTHSFFKIEDRDPIFCNEQHTDLS